MSYNIKKYLKIKKEEWIRKKFLQKNKKILLIGGALFTIGLIIGVYFPTIAISILNFVVEIIKDIIIGVVTNQLII